MTSRVVVLLFALLLLFAGSDRAQAQRRIALLIGNANYVAAPVLKNPANDVSTLASALKSAGFDKVQEFTNLNRDEMIKALRDFEDDTATADVAVIYFAGHGFELNGMNFLAPINATLASVRDVEDQTVSLDRMLRAVQDAKLLKLVVLDACRNNPFATKLFSGAGLRSISRGLARVDPTSINTLVAFSAKAGTVASDGDAENSPFAASFSKHAVQPGVDVRLMLGQVRDDVLQATGNQQEPFLYGSLGGGIVPLIDSRPVVSQAAAQTPTGDASCFLAGAHWTEAKAENKREFYEEHLRLFGGCPFAGFAKGALAKLDASDDGDKTTLDFKSDSLKAGEPSPAALSVAESTVQPTDCDVFAGSTRDPDLVGKGVRYSDIDPPKAILACEDAVKNYPNERRFIFQLGRAKDAAKEYSLALDLYKKAAGMQSVAAMANVGYIYETGRGVLVDFAEARRWYQMAANLGNPDAMSDIGGMYRDGNGVGRDFQLAMNWYQKAAKLNEPRAMANIGYFYETGKGVDANINEAVRWYKKATELGNETSAKRLKEICSVRRICLDQTTTLPVAADKKTTENVQD